MARYEQAYEGTFLQSMQKMFEYRKKIIQTSKGWLNFGKT